MNRTKFFSPLGFRLKTRALMLVVLVILAGVELGIGNGILLNRPYLLALPFLLPLIMRVSASSRVSSGTEYGSMLVLFCMVVIKLGLSTGTASKLPISLILTGMWTALHVGKMILEHNIRFVRNGINIPGLVFVSMVLLSTLWSRFLLDPQVIINDRFLNVQIGTIGVTILSVLLTVMCFNLVRQVRTIRVCYWIFLGASLFYLPFYIFESTLGANAASKVGPDDLSIQTLSRLINAGGLFPLWFCAITTSLLLFARDLTRRQRILMFIGLGGWFFRLFVLTLARISGWLPVVVALLVVLFIYSRKWFFFLIIVTVVLIVFNYSMIYDAVVVSKEKEGTLSGETSRGNLLQQALTVAKDHPVLGTGPAGYANYYLTYFRDLALSTHNNYLDMLLQYGVLGLLAFMWLCFAMIKEVWWSSRCQTRGTFEYGFTIGTFAGAIGMMPAMWLGDWVIPFAYNQTISGFNYTAHNWLWPGLAIALAYIAKERQFKESKPPEAGVTN
jgi:O-antigen ligase